MVAWGGLRMSVQLPSPSRSDTEVPYNTYVHYDTYVCPPPPLASTGLVSVNHGDQDCTISETLDEWPQDAILTNFLPLT